MFSCNHDAGIATANATVVTSHNTALDSAAANRTLQNLLCDSPQVGGLAEVLGAVVDDAHQPRAGRHGRVPVGVHDPGQLVGGHAGDVFEAQLVHRVVVAGEQIGGRLHLRHVVGTVPVAGVIARQVQPNRSTQPSRVHTCSTPATSAS